ncbi:MAG: serine/threonine-protein kinase [Chloroflexi bacterium]|nr:serine/threonine-protein kinase [Chloroflexota bacterium]
MTLEKDTLIHNRYRIVDILGQGGMGSVYRAIDENLGVSVALKENLFTTDEYARQFRLEAVILANLRHPNLPRVSDHFVMGDQGQYLVMDFIEGEDLRYRMERLGMLSEDEAIHIGASICDALGYLHTRKPPILHRDIKPGNVKITPDGHIFLVDFGLAKVYQSASQATTTGARAMTPGYSPPEQYGTARTDPRTDIYSLGATLYAALTGVIPEDGLARAMDNAQLTPLRKRNTKVSRRMATSIEKAMAVDPIDRFQTAEEFKKALLASKSKTQQLPRHVHDYAPAAGSGGAQRNPRYGCGFKSDPVEIQTQGTPSAPALAARGTAVCLAAQKTEGARTQTAHGGDSLPYHFDSDSFGVRAFPRSGHFACERARDDSIHRADPNQHVNPDAHRAAADPHGSDSHAHTADSHFHQKADGYVYLHADADPHPRHAGFDTPVATTAPVAIIGGGTGQIAFASTRTGTPQIFLADTNGENAFQVTNIPTGACQPSFSPDGQQLVFISPCKGNEEIYYNTSLYIINADGTGMTALDAAPGGSFDPAWSPDGKFIAFASMRTGQMEIFTISMEDLATVKQITSGAQRVESRMPAWSPDSSQIVYVVRRLGVYQIWLMNADGSDARQIIRSGVAYNDYFPAWSPKSDLILFNQNCATRYCNAYLMSTSATDRSSEQGLRVILNIALIENVDYSPDGFYLAYEGVGEAGNLDIFFMTVSGGDRVRLTTDPAQDFHPDWRPAPPTP